jgi:hypothetical protein
VLTTHFVPQSFHSNITKPHLPVVLAVLHTVKVSGALVALKGRILAVVGPVAGALTSCKEGGQQ